MLERLSPRSRNLALAGLALLLVWSSWTVRAVLNPLILGYLLAFVLNPMVRGLERRGWGRRSAANLIFLAFFVAGSLLSLAIFWQGRALVRDVGESDSFQRGLEQVEAWAGELLGEERPEGADGEEPASAPAQGQAAADEPAALAPVASGAGELSPAEGGASGSGPQGLSSGSPESRDAAVLARILQELTEEQNQARALEGAAKAWPHLRSFFGSLVALVTLLALLPIYAYFLLFELDRIHAFVYRYIPKAEKERLARIGRQVGEVLANFFRGRLLICLLKGALLTAGLLVVQVPYAVFLGMGSGFLSLVPFVGPVLGFGVAFVLAAFPPGLAEVAAAAGPVQPVWVPILLALLRTGAVFVAAELIEGYVLLPKVLGDSLGLHPVVVLASIFIGGAALGMFGFLIALPLTAALVILGREMVLPALADFADEDAEPEAQEQERAGAAPEVQGG